MKRYAGAILAVLVATVAAGAIGGWLGVRYGLHEARADTGLDDMLHHRLKLTGEQNARIEGLERAFAVRKAALEGEMKAANRELAAALTTDHSYGPAAEAAIAHFHHAMGELQQATVQHILAMRAVLTPEQAAQFDQTVSETLAPGS